MSTESTIFISTVGRIVWGHPGKSKDKTDPQTKEIKRNNAGEIIQQWVFGVAFPAAEFEASILPYLQQEAYKGYPNGIPGKFSWKFKHFNDVDDKGKRYGEREGCEDCYILTLSTELKAPEIYRKDGLNYFQIGEKDIKTGDYVAVQISAKVNIPTSHLHTPGLYINPEMVLLIGQGTEIVGQAADPSQVFGGQQFALPPGATAPATGQPQAMPGQAVPPSSTPAQHAVNPQPNAAPQVATTAPSATTYPTNAPQAMPGQPTPATTTPSTQTPVSTATYPSNAPQAMPGQAAATQPAHDFVQNTLNTPQTQPGQPVAVQPPRPI